MPSKALETPLSTGIIIGLGEWNEIKAEGRVGAVYSSAIARGGVRL